MLLNLVEQGIADRLPTLSSIPTVLAAAFAREYFGLNPPSYGAIA